MASAAKPPPFFVTLPCAAWPPPAAAAAAAAAWRWHTLQHTKLSHAATSGALMANTTLAPPVATALAAARVAKEDGSGTATAATNGSNVHAAESACHTASTRRRRASGTAW